MELDVSCNHLYFNKVAFVVSESSYPHPFSWGGCGLFF